MRTLFGTDGIRGIANEELDGILAFKCGNALTCLKENIKVVVGRDSRHSGDMLFCAFAAGVASGGGTVYNLGMMPTAGVAYFTREFEADFGVVISASHNPKEYNGIKIFGSDGYKLSDDMESAIESNIGRENYVNPEKIGKIIDHPEGLERYQQSLIDACDCRLDGMKIVMDLSNGASSLIAPAVFRALGAEIIVLNDDYMSGNINDGCGCLYPEVICKAVIDYGANMAVAFDGDSDRLIACDADGNLINGDVIIYILSKYYKSKGTLDINTVVGTLHTNMGIENAIKRLGIKFMRSDIGDRYVIELMRKTGSLLGGEQSGHIIIGNKSTTGDGILTAVILCEVVQQEKRSLHTLGRVTQFPQENINVIVDNKMRVLENPELKALLKEIEKRVEGKGRILVRASGTEPKIRIMAECENIKMTRSIAAEIADLVNQIANID